MSLSFRSWSKSNRYYDFPAGIRDSRHPEMLDIPAIPIQAVPIDHGWDQLSLEPGKSDSKVVQWVNDFQGLINQNKEAIKTAIKINDPHLQEKLEEMTDRMSSIWRAAKDDQKAAWNEAKRQSFGSEELRTKLIDVICCFESRWIPHEHCACPICWKVDCNRNFRICLTLSII
jgi:hypothetical protein